MSENISWDDLQLFIAVAKSGGLSAAAKSTQKSPATLGRRMHALERALGRDLFIRHERGYQLVEEGKKLLDELTSIESQVLKVITPLGGNEKPLVKISAGTWTTLMLIQNIDKLIGTVPDIRLKFLSTEKILDINHREAVIGFRNARPTDDALVCRKLTRVDFAPYATSSTVDYWIKVSSDTPSARWLNKNIKQNLICEVNEPRNSLDLTLAGKGIAVLPTFIGDKYPELIRKGEIIEELSHEQWLVTHHDDRYLPEVRLLLNRISSMFDALN